MQETDVGQSRKADAARRQLGTALFLWLNDLDPISVHALATGGCEVANGLVKSVGKPFAAFALEVHPDLTEGGLVKLRNVYWNALKHANHRDGHARDDEKLLATSLDAENEARLCEGWFDLMQLMPAPIEAQVLTAWYLAKHGDPAELDNSIDELFPNLRLMSPIQQKSVLRGKIEEVRQLADLMEDERTDRRPLILSAQ
jgi:hypothetical protein